MLQIEFEGKDTRVFGNPANQVPDRLAICYCHIQLELCNMEALIKMIGRDRKENTLLNL